MCEQCEHRFRWCYFDKAVVLEYNTNTVEQLKAKDSTKQAEKNTLIAMFLVAACIHSCTVSLDYYYTAPIFQVSASNP